MVVVPASIFGIPLISSQQSTPHSLRNAFTGESNGVKLISQLPEKFKRKKILVGERERMENFGHTRKLCKDSSDERRRERERETLVRRKEGRRGEIEEETVL